MFVFMVINWIVSSLESWFPLVPQTPRHRRPGWQPDHVYYFLDDQAPRLRARMWALLTFNTRQVSFWRRRMARLAILPVTGHFFVVRIKGEGYRTCSPLDGWGGGHPSWMEPLLAPNEVQLGGIKSYPMSLLQLKGLALDYPEANIDLQAPAWRLEPVLE